MRRRDLRQLLNSEEPRIECRGPERKQRIERGRLILFSLRQPGEPYEFYAEQDLTAVSEWKPFPFDFSFTEDREAFVMFTKQETGTLDLVGLTVSEKK